MHVCAHSALLNRSWDRTQVSGRSNRLSIKKAHFIHYYNIHREQQNLCSCLDTIRSGLRSSASVQNSVHISVHSPVHESSPSLVPRLFPPPVFDRLQYKNGLQGVTLKVGTRKREMRNGEMGKWEEGTLHFTQQTARCFVTAVMRKSMSIHAFTERSSLPDSWHQMGMQWHCITVCKLALYV